MTETQNADFINEVKEELKYLGMKHSELAAKCKIPQNRFIVLMRSKAKFKTDEITEIKELLGI